METGPRRHLWSRRVRCMSGLDLSLAFIAVCLPWLGGNLPNRTFGKDSGASSVTLTDGPARPRPKKPAPSLLQGVRDLRCSLRPRPGVNRTYRPGCLAFESRGTPTGTCDFGQPRYEGFAFLIQVKISY